jgi:hypothetical protein
MAAVQTQQLAQISDLAALGPPSAALAMLSDAVKNQHLRTASGQVLSAYGVRFGRTLGASFTLVTWGDFTIGLVISLATYSLLGITRGFNPETPDGKAIVGARDAAVELLNEISDITNKNPRFDPDAVDSTPSYEELGALSASEGGPLDQADNWARTCRSRGRPLNPGGLW